MDLQYYLKYTKTNENKTQNVIDDLSKSYNEQYHKAISKFDILKNTDRVDIIYKSNQPIKCIIDYGREWKKNDFNPLVREVWIDHNTVKIGDVVEFESKIDKERKSYMFVDEIESRESYDIGFMQPINYLLKFKDSNNILHQYPCISLDTTMYSLGIKEIKYYEQGDAKLQITITDDANTRKLVEKTRLIVDDRAWAIARVSKLQKGLIQLTCGQSTFYDKDDRPNEIPYNNWDELNKNTFENIDVPSTSELNVDIQGNNNIVEGLYDEWTGLVYENSVQVEKDVIWEVVQNSGLVSIIRNESNKYALQNIGGNIGDTFTIRCKLTEDNSIYFDKVITITRM